MDGRSRRSDRQSLSRGRGPLAQERRVNCGTPYTRGPIQADHMHLVDCTLHCTPALRGSSSRGAGIKRDSWHPGPTMPALAGLLEGAQAAGADIHPPAHTINNHEVVLHVGAKGAVPLLRPQRPLRLGRLVPDPPAPHRPLVAQLTGRLHALRLPPDRRLSTGQRPSPAQHANKRLPAPALGDTANPPDLPTHPASNAIMPRSLVQTLGGQRDRRACPAHPLILSAMPGATLRHERRVEPAGGPDTSTPAPSRRLAVL